MGFLRTNLCMKVAPKMHTGEARVGSFEDGRLYGRRSVERADGLRARVFKDIAVDVPQFTIIKRWGWESLSLALIGNESGVGA